MRPVSYHRQAKRYLEKMPGKRAQQILAAVQTLAASNHPAIESGVKAMSGDWQGWMRVRIGSYRVIFRIQPSAAGVETLFVLIVGPRGDVY